ncbi:hypothetical protein AURDEDRAFT_114770 [Auricularia subglabra TFB-10046 SS5]|nr:hypothetical protein AURDEDRAFT_114770 [Auricularia subglabra TFB-10046 SS5]
MFISRYRSLDSLLEPGSKPVIIGYRDHMATKRSATTTDRGLAGLVGPDRSPYSTGSRRAASPPILRLPHDLLSEHASTVDSADLGTPISRLHPPSSGLHVYDPELSPLEETPSAYSPPVASRHVEKWRAGAPTAVLMPGDHPMIQGHGNAQPPATPRTPKFLSVYEPPLFSDGPDLRLAGRRASDEYFPHHPHQHQRRGSYAANGNGHAETNSGPPRGSVSAGRFIGALVRFVVLPLLSVAHLSARTIGDASARGIEAGRVFVAVDDAEKLGMLVPQAWLNSIVLFVWNLSILLPLSILATGVHILQTLWNAPRTLARAAVKRVEDSDGAWRQFVDPLIYAETMPEKLSGVWRAWERYAWKDL